jgi:hypothetical protein
MGDESDGIGVCLSDSFILSDPVSAPVDVEKQQGEANSVLVRDLILPGLVLLRPSDIAIVDELRLVSLLELTLKDLLFGLQGEVLVVPAPIVEVVIVKADRPQQGAGCSQHIFIRMIKAHSSSNVVFDVAPVVG